MKLSHTYNIDLLQSLEIEVEYSPDNLEILSIIYDNNGTRSELSGLIWDVNGFWKIAQEIDWREKTIDDTDMDDDS